VGYAEWKAAYDNAVDLETDAQKRDAALARVLNLESETRVNHFKTAFLDELATRFETLCATGKDPTEAAKTALNDALHWSWTTKPLRLGLRATSRLDEAYSYASARDLAQHGCLGDINPEDPPARLQIRDGFVFKSVRKPIVWISPDTCPDDPYEVAAGLGLPHFENHILFRLELNLKGISAFVPSCFDARLYEAWQVAPETEATICGRTRHVETGKRLYRELVIETTKAQGNFRVAIRVPRKNTIVKVPSLRPNFLCGRQ